MSRQHRNRRPTTRAATSSRSVSRWPWLVGIVGALVVVVAVVATEGNRPVADATERDPASIEAGAEIFAANCAVCHGPDLLGSQTGPPLLHVIYAPNHHGDESFQRAVAGGVQPHHWGFGPMAAVPGLTRDDVAKIIDFVRSEQEAAGIFTDPSHG